MRWVQGRDDRGVKGSPPWASPSKTLPYSLKKKSMSYTARATITAGRIKKSLDELGRFDWDVVAHIIQDALDDLQLQAKQKPWENWPRNEVPATGLTERDMKRLR